MTTTYDPKHPKYLDEADVRAELTRVYDVCSGCRLCFELCASFPTLFELVDRFDDHDAGRLTPVEQDRVVEACFQCKRCYVNCPYVPGLHDWSLDFPRLMLRAGAMRQAAGHVSVRDRRTTQVMARTDLVGRLATATAPLADKMVTAREGSAVRRIVGTVSGVSAVRLLPPYAKQRFSTWFARRPEPPVGNRQGRVTVFPTCLVEYHEPPIGHDVVKVYERNGVECSISSSGCCGAPWLHAGDIGQFRRIARKNAATLAAEIRSGTDVVVPQPTCAYVLKRDYPDYVRGADVELVASHTYDVAEYLMKLHRADDTALDTEFPGEVPETVTYHTPCHVRAQEIGLASRDLMELTGAAVKLVEQCAGIGDVRGLRAEHDHVSLPIAAQLGTEIDQAGGDVVAGDCHLANTAITEQTGRIPVHPIQLVARAYGIAEEP